MSSHNDILNFFSDKLSTLPQILKKISEVHKDLTVGGKTISVKPIKTYEEFPRGKLRQLLKVFNFSEVKELKNVDIWLDYNTIGYPHGNDYNKN